uniref:Stress response protein nst1 n=1 Tax=Rhizophora mucronata TaxID=61149 RepID=A0A2P2M7K2_RHIMU
MCILCVIQKWSRQVAAMLPWLVIPLIGLWALSQLLPPAFRFEITSPRLACVSVLLVTLFWYEILMPHLSAWRVRRNARLRERKRSEAIELQKLRKTATRKCRNCLTPYRDQNPGGGKFMCSYCGHVSKRPVLDLPVPCGLGISNSGIIKDLVGRGGKILNGKVWSDNGWMCNQVWLENGHWVAGPISGKSSYQQKSGNGIFWGHENCLAEKSYPGILMFACKLLTYFFFSIRWLWRKVFRVSSSNDNDSSDTDHRVILAKRGENGTNYQESRGEKARRKAEERRQARLEKELLEEEERKQREEVARLVEERRRLRDEIMAAEKDHSKLSSAGRERDRKKEAEKKRQERRKEKDKGSSKSNSDAEELEKKAGKEGEQKRDFEKKNETDRREHHRPGTVGVKGQNIESSHAEKYTSASNFSRANTGTRYLDRMKGTFLSSSTAFSGSGFFRKTVNMPAAVIKENKVNCSVDHVHIPSHRRDVGPPKHSVGKSTMNGDHKNVSHSVPPEPQLMSAPKKSWQQLFIRQASVPSSSNAHVISRPNSKAQTEVQSLHLSAKSSSIQSFDNPINFGLPSPFIISSYPNVTSSTSSGFAPPTEPIFSCVVEGAHEPIREEQELFEDPCYVPDPISLLGPVSESLENFQLDLGTSFPLDMGLDRPHSLNNLPASPELSKPSPIESPSSRLRIAEEKHNSFSSSWFSTTPKAQDLHTSPVNDVHVNEKGTWQMWNSSALGQDGLGLVGGAGSWLLPQEQNRSVKEDVLLPPANKNVASLFSKGDQVFSGTHSPQKVFLGNSQNGGVSIPVTGSVNIDPWLQNALFPPLSGNSSHLSHKCLEESTQNEMIYGSPRGTAANHSFELPTASPWSKKEWAVQGSGESVGRSPVPRPNVGGLFPPSQDVQSLWSFDRKMECEGPNKTSFGSERQSAAF